MLTQEYRMTGSATMQDPEEGYTKISAEVELNIEEIIYNEDFSVEDLEETSLMDYVQQRMDQDTEDFGWCQVEYKGKVVNFSKIWDLTFNELRCETIYFLDTEN